MRCHLPSGTGQKANLCRQVCVGRPKPVSRRGKGGGMGGDVCATAALLSVLLPDRQEILQRYQTLVSLNRLLYHSQYLGQLECLVAMYYGDCCHLFVCIVSACTRHASRSTSHSCNNLSYGGSHRASLPAHSPVIIVHVRGNESQNNVTFHVKALYTDTLLPVDSFHCPTMYLVWLSCCRGVRV